jgi:hypothetical protein
MVLTKTQMATIRQLAMDFDFTTLGEYVEELMRDAYSDGYGDGESDGYSRGWEDAYERDDY